MAESFVDTSFVVKYFGKLADLLNSDYSKLSRKLDAARFPDTPRKYVAKTYYYSLLAALGIFAFTFLIVKLGGLPLRISLASGGVTGVVGGVLMYVARRYYPGYVADVRGRRIDTSMDNVVNFMYCLGNGNMETKEILDTVVEYEHVFGEAATELRVISSGVNVLGKDLTTSMEEVANETPSNKMSEFLHDFSEIIRTREDVSGWLEEKNKEYYREAEANQERLIDKLEVLSQGFLVVFVAAPILTITILVILGLIGFRSLAPLRTIIYVAIPGASVGFIIFLDIIFEDPTVKPKKEFEIEEAARYRDVKDRVTDREVPEEKMDSLYTDPLKKRLLDLVRNPLRKFKHQPIYSLYFAAALGILYFAARIAYFASTGGTLVTPEVEPFFVGAAEFSPGMKKMIAEIDNYIVQSLLIIFLIYGMFYQLKLRYLDRVEYSLPPFLRHLRTGNQAGKTLTTSVINLRSAELGVLNEYAEDLITDIKWKATLDRALRNFSQRVNAPAVTRATVIINRASQVSGNMSHVIEVTTRDAELQSKLHRSRRKSMFVYTMITYVSYMVFIMCIAILLVFFVPVIPNTVGEAAQQAAQEESVSQQQAQMIGGGADRVSVSEYDDLFFHALIIEALITGLIAGKMARGSVKAGVIHAFILMFLGYVFFVEVIPIFEAMASSPV